MSHVTRKRIKFMYAYRIIRNGEVVKEVKRQRDLLVWRGQMVLAYLLSQSAVGTSTSTWKAVVSSNSTTPDMGDDSGNPESNEFSPTLGTPATVTYSFEPTNKSSGAMQNYSHLKITGSITLTSSGTLRKIGIIDNVATPNRHIIVEDAVVPVTVYVSDVIEVEYWIPLW